MTSTAGMNRPRTMGLGWGAEPNRLGGAPDAHLLQMRNTVKLRKAHEGFTKLMEKGGVWEVVKGRGRAITNTPQWLWDGLGTVAPEATEVACDAADACTAARYFMVIYICPRAFLRGGQSMIIPRASERSHVLPDSEG